jgi:hypothetical protein
MGAPERISNTTRKRMTRADAKSAVLGLEWWWRWRGGGGAVPFNDLTALHHEDLVAVHDGAETVRDDNARATYLNVTIIQ